MYSRLVDTILLLDFWMKFLIGMGLITGILCVIWICKLGAQYYNDEDNKALFCRNLFFSIAFCCLCTGTIIVGNSKFMNPNWVIIRAAAPVLDEYVEKHPEAIYNPDTILTVTNDTALSVFQSIQTFPDILKRIANGEVLPSKEELDKAEFEEFKRWKNNR